MKSAHSIGSYAVRSGLSRGAIQKARKAGRLVVYGDGSINAAASDVRRAEMTDPDQQRCSVGGDTFGTAGVEVAQNVLAETQPAIQPLVPYLDTLRWVFIAVALAGKLHTRQSLLRASTVLPQANPQRENLPEGGCQHIVLSW